MSKNKKWYAVYEDGMRNQTFVRVCESKDDAGNTPHCLFVSTDRDEAFEFSILYLEKRRDSLNYEVKKLIESHSKKEANRG